MWFSDDEFYGENRRRVILLLSSLTIKAIVNCNEREGIITILITQDQLITASRDLKSNKQAILRSTRQFVHSSRSFVESITQQYKTIVLNSLFSSR